MAQELADFQKKFSKELRTGLLSMLSLLAIDSAHGPTYGYRIIKDLEGASAGRFKFPEGTVYPILSQLSDMGYLKAYWGEATEGPRRKYYKITKDGKGALEMCLEEWTSTAEITTSIIESLSKTKEKRTQGSGKI